MRRLGEILALIFTVGYVMAAGVAAYHQHEKLTKEKKSAYVYVDVIQETAEYTDDETVIIGDVEPDYGIYEMTDEEIAEEDYWGELELLAACVEVEAGNQGLEGKRLVADVILNRVDNPDFPDSIEGVITQPYAFTSYWNGMVSSVSISDETFQAVSMELEERSNTELLFFTAYAYGEYGTPCFQNGDHYFSTK
jgi:spore germination cell wall hydrolase CwlJ-like protein